MAQGDKAAIQGNMKSNGKGDEVKDRVLNDPLSGFWGVLLIFLILSLVFIIAYGAVVGSWQIVWMELSIGFGACALGVLMGFLFGLPRGLATLVSAAPVTNGNANPVSQNGNATTTAVANGNNAGVNSPLSTNLEQVSDWLTKILIGAGLVGIGKIGEVLHEIGEYVCDNTHITATGTNLIVRTVDGANVLTQAVVVSFAILGFMAGYLWTRINYSEIQARADRNILLPEQFKKEINKEVNQAVTEAKEGIKTELVQLGDKIEENKQAISNPGLLENPDISQWPAETREKYDLYMAMPKDSKTDPAADVFANHPSSIDTRSLEASIVKELPYNRLILELKVTGTAAAPLEGEVTFLLHPTYTTKTRRLIAKDNQAKIEVGADGAYTLVAIMDNGQTVLTYNLQNIPGAPQWFIDN